MEFIGGAVFWQSKILAECVGEINKIEQEIDLLEERRWQSVWEGIVGRDHRVAGPGRINPS